MIPDEWSLLTFAVNFAFAMLSLSMVLAFVRLVLGPSLPDRVVALELFATLVVGMIAVFTIESGTSKVLRASIVLALVSFLGAVAFAKYVEKRGTP